jgi:hypothetical protein
LEDKTGRTRTMTLRGVGMSILLTRVGIFRTLTLGYDHGIGGTYLVFFFFLFVCPVKQIVPSHG